MSLIKILSFQKQTFFLTKTKTVTVALQHFCLNSIKLNFTQGLVVHKKSLNKIYTLYIFFKVNLKL